MPASVGEVKHELREHFGDRITGSRFYEDYAAIGSYLSDPGQYMPALRQLHTEMEGKLQHNMSQGVLGQLYPNWRRGFQQYLTGVYRDMGGGRPALDGPQAQIEAMAYEAFHKVLTDALKDNEIVNGFKVGNSNERPAIIVGNAGASFNTLLRAKQPFKDIGAGREHGENSHRIQWYLISKLGGLDNSITDIYSKLPGWKTTYQAPRYFYMWEFLVDRDGVPTNAAIIPFKTADQADFRAPSNVNRWLMTGRTSGLELLEACLTNRFNRRHGLMMDEYLAKKLLLDFSTLGHQGRQELFAFVTGSNAVLNR